MRLLFIAAFVSATAVVSAQGFEVPKKYKLKKAEDFANYENDFIGAYKWLMATSMGEQAEKRKEVNKFLLAWISGAPNVTVEIRPEIVTFMEKNPDLLLVFMTGWAQYALSTGDKSKSAGTLNGLESVVEFYEKNKTKLNQDPNVENYVAMKADGTLEDFVTKTVK